MNLVCGNTVTGRVRIALATLLSALLAACAAAPDRAAMPMVEAKAVQLEMRITNRFWDQDVRRAAVELARQSSAALDAPLRLDLVVRPGQLRDGELAVRFAVDTEGHVRDVQVLRVATALGSEIFVREVLRTLYMWRFVPPTRGGKPTGFCCIELTMEVLKQRDDG
jgi:TonB family protein